MRTLLILAILAIAGCAATPRPGASSADSAPSAAAPSVGAAGSAAASPETSGKPKRDLKGSPILGSYTKEIARFQGRLLPGTFTLTFNVAGVRFKGPEGPPFTAGGVKGFDASEITFGPDEHCGPGQVSPGRYRWTLTGDVLAFEVVAESCNVREQLLTDGDWTRSR